MSGWISLHRSILDWEWYDDLNVSRLFIHCILKANHAHGKWQGIEIERGSFITSLDKLSKETGLTVSQIRTCIKKLKSTSEIASKSHAQHTVMYIKNYDSYQGNDKVNDKALASESQSIDTALATNNKNNNNNKDNKEPIVPSKTKPSKFKFNNEDFRFANEMFNRVLVIAPSAKKPNFENWANTIRLMREADKRNHNEMWLAFDWANKDSFWCSNILSPDKLRKQFDKLTVKINETSRPIIQQDKSDGRSNAQRAIDNARDKRDRERESMRSPVVTDGRLIHGQMGIEERSDSITTLVEGDWEPI